MSGYESQNTLAVNSISAASGTYQKIDLGIKSTDDGTRNIVSELYGGYIKNSIDAILSGIGLAYSVTKSCQMLENDPNSYFVVGDKKYIPNTPVGNLHPYTEDGSPAGGCRTIHMLG